MPQKAKKIPIYLQIKKSILSKIHEGIWKAGSTIPTEMALCHTFGVSRMTVNRALKELTEERVLERRQGSGTIVAQQQFNHTFIEVRNIAKEIKQAHRLYRAELIGKRARTLKELPYAVQEAFATGDLSTRAADCPIFEIKIIHYADAFPLQYEERWVDSRFVPEFLSLDFTMVNTSDYLIARVPLERGIYAISATLASEDIANALQLDLPAAVLLLNRTTFSEGQVVTYVNMWHTSERYPFSGQL